jgi:hypothetical protein
MRNLFRRDGPAPSLRPETLPDADILAHPELARMSLRVLADLPFPRPDSPSERTHHSV